MTITCAFTYRYVLTDPTALREEIEGIEEMEEEEEGEIPLSLDETDSDDAEKGEAC